PDAQQKHEEQTQAKDMNVLESIQANPGAGLTKLATILGWNMKDGAPYKMLVKRSLDRLTERKLVTSEGTVTKAGKDTLNRWKAQRAAEKLAAAASDDGIM